MSTKTHRRRAPSRWATAWSTVLVTNRLNNQTARFRASLARRFFRLVEIDVVAVQPLALTRWRSGWRARLVHG